MLNSYDKSVLNIYEQYPLLPREQTVQIANDMGVLHPEYRRVTKKDEGQATVPLPNKVMSTDFLIEKEKDGQIVQVAIWVKTSTDVDPSKSKNKGNLHKAEIEVTYWLENEIKCYGILKESINRNLIL